MSFGILLEAARTSKCGLLHRDIWEQVGQLPASIVTSIYLVRLGESRAQAQAHLVVREVDRRVARKSKAAARAGLASEAPEARWGLAAVHWSDRSRRIPPLRARRSWPKYRPFTHPGKACYHRFQSLLHRWRNHGFWLGQANRRDCWRIEFVEFREAQALDPHHERGSAERPGRRSYAARNSCCRTFQYMSPEVPQGQDAAPRTRAIVCGSSRHPGSTRERAPARQPWATSSVVPRRAYLSSFSWCVLTALGGHEELGRKEQGQ
jgi:hypothetical protein